MARCPFAVWRPIAENSYQPKITPTQAIAHSAVDAPGPTSLFGYFDRTDVTVETHFFIKNDGVIEQYLDTTVRADGNRFANVRAVSFETEDEGDPNNREWTPAQVATIKRLLAWLFQTHPAILPRMCPAWDLPGVGYHTMWGAPSEWTPSVKTCPGTIRKVQWAREIEPWIRGYGKAKDWFDMANVTDLKNAVRSVLNEGTGHGYLTWRDTNKGILSKINNLTNLVRANKINYQTLAQAIVAQIPEGEAVNQAVVEAGVRKVFAELAD
jgi:hypothetical protein